MHGAVQKSEGVFTIYTENTEILVGKSIGTYHSMWNVSEIMGHRLNQCAFSIILEFLTNTRTFCDLFILHLGKLQHWIFTPKIFTRMDRVNGKRPLSLLFSSTRFDHLIVLKVLTHMIFNYTEFFYE